MEEVTQLPAEEPAPPNPWTAQGFTVTDEHAQLVAAMVVCFVAEPAPGAPMIDPAQPYGSADVYGDMRRILNRPDATDGDMIDLQTQTDTALQILLNTQRLVPGEYVTPHGCCAWAPV